MVRLDFSAENSTDLLKQVRDFVNGLSGQAVEGTSETTNTAAEPDGKAETGTTTRRATRKSTADTTKQDAPPPADQQPQVESPEPVKPKELKLEDIQECMTDKRVSREDKLALLSDFMISKASELEAKEYGNFAEAFRKLLPEGEKLPFEK